MFPSVSFAAAGDADNDGLRDEVETGTGVYVSPTNTGTNPAVADSDGDSMPDGMEVNLGTNPVDPSSKVRRPNIIYILADDLGYGDVGCFWQNQRSGSGIWKFATPGLDAMAAQGAKMTHHYVGAPICVSSRASFLLGQTQGNSDIRNTQFDKALYDNHNLARTLKSAGYRTIHVGKCGVAGTVANPLQSSSNLVGHPLKRGFDRFFGYLRHDDGHEHYPRNGTASRVAVIHDDYTPVTDAYVDLFSSDAWTACAKKSIIEETTTHPERPFFLYLSYDTPHFYGETSPTAAYPAGKGLNGGIQWTGSPSYANTATNDPAKVDNLNNRDITAGSNWFPAAQKYVSMIRRMDDSVTDILQTIRDLGIADNTLVVFTSDNGPADTETPPFTFQSYAGFEGIKSDLWEGGIRVPTIAWWPGTIPATNQLSNIREISKPCANWDWMATFSDLAKIPTPANSDGTSLLPSLTGQGVQKDRGYLYFEFSYGGFTSRYQDFPTHGGEAKSNMQAIRIGDFKGVRYHLENASDPFRIYNVVTDPKESTDISGTRPDLVARMMELSLGARRKGAGIYHPLDYTQIPATTPTSPVSAGLAWKAFEGYWPWLPDFKSLTTTSSGISAEISAAPLTRASDAGLSFEGYLSVPTNGAYTFKLASDAGACLWIHDGLVIDNDFNFTSNKTSDVVYLAAGLHPIRLYYRHQGGAPGLALSYSGPGIPLQPVPASALFNEGPVPSFQLQPDIAVTRRNTSATINAVANDSANYPISLASAGPSSSGKLTLIGGKVVYTPSRNFIGTDSFTYSVTGGSATASSVITANVLFDNETWIPFDETAGTAVKCISPTSTLAATFTGSPAPDNCWLPGRFKNCLRFDGADDQVDLPGLALPTGSAPRTFACWMRAPAYSTSQLETIFSYGSGAAGKLFAVRIHNIPNTAGNAPARLEVSGGTVVGTKPLNDSQWHHLAVVVADRNNDSVLNVSETQLYVDGVLDTISISNPMPINTEANTTPCIGGSNHASNYHYKGDVDDVRIFPQALSSTEIASLSNTVTDLIAPPEEDYSDADGDGVTASLELAAGTDPNDPTSVFRITSTSITAQGFVVSWSAIAGKTYQIEESSNMATWSPVAGFSPMTPTVDIPNASATIPSTQATKRFLRVSVK